MSTSNSSRHPLSAIADKWLSTLERKPAVPCGEVEALIRDAGYPCFSAWMEFHERFAGYYEPIGNDSALWGLVHENPTWLEPMQPDVERELNEEVWSIACADTHPSFGYRLDHRGEMADIPAESFEVVVERSALGWDFRQRGATRALVADELRSDDFRQLFGAEILPFHIVAASDRFFRYYMSTRYLLVEDACTGRFLRGRTHR